MKINFSFNKQTVKYKSLIKRLFQTALEVTEITSNISVNVALIDKSQIQALNKKYRAVDKVTDVLSFPMIDDIKNIQNEPDFFIGDCNIGDIYINLEQATKQAEEYGHSLMRELGFLALHGFLHLLGYDHILKQDEVVMFELQNKILEIVNLGRN